MVGTGFPHLEVPARRNCFWKACAKCFQTVALEPGDLVTHCIPSQPPHPWSPAGSPASSTARMESPGWTSPTDTHTGSAAPRCRCPSSLPRLWDGFGCLDVGITQSPISSRSGCWQPQRDAAAQENRRITGIKHPRERRVPPPHQPLCSSSVLRAPAACGAFVRCGGGRRVTPNGGGTERTRQRCPWGGQRPRLQLTGQGCSSSSALPWAPRGRFGLGTRGSAGKWGAGTMGGPRAWRE